MSSFKWTDLVPTFIAGGTVADHKRLQQLDLLRQIYNQDVKLQWPTYAVGQGAWLAQWQPGRKERLQ